MGDIREDGLQAAHLLRDVEDPSLRLQYVYLFHPDHNPTQDDFAERPVLEASVPVDAVYVSCLDDGMKEDGRLPYGWKEAWEDRLVPYRASDEDIAAAYAGVEFVVPNTVPPEQIASYHPDGLDGYRAEDEALLDADVDPTLLFD